MQFYRSQACDSRACLLNREMQITSSLLLFVLGSTLFPRPDRSVSLGKNLMRFAVVLQHAI